MFQGTFRSQFSFTRILLGFCGAVVGLDPTTQLGTHQITVYDARRMDVFEATLVCWVYSHFLEKNRSAHQNLVQEILDELFLEGS